MAGVLRTARFILGCSVTDGHDTNEILNLSTNPHQNWSKSFQKFRWSGFRSGRHGFISCMCDKELVIFCGGGSTDSRNSRIEYICKVWRGCGKDWRVWATAGQLKATDKWHDTVAGRAVGRPPWPRTWLCGWVGRGLGGKRGHHRRNLSAWNICKRTSTNLIRFGRVISWLWFCGEEAEFLYSLLFLSRLYYTRVWPTGYRNAWILQSRCTVSYQFISRQVKFDPNCIS